jgi:hypothetical protein
MRVIVPGFQTQPSQIFDRRFDARSGGFRWNVLPGISHRMGRSEAVIQASLDDVII